MRKKNQEKVSNIGFFAIMRMPISEILLKNKLAHNHNFTILQEDDNTKRLQSEDKINYQIKELEINLDSSFQQCPGRNFAVSEHLG